MIFYVLLYILYYLNDSIAVAHHGDEKIQKDDHVDHGIRTKHQQAPESSVALDPLKMSRVEDGNMERRNIYFRISKKDFWFTCEFETFYANPAKTGPK